jgi:hypothetical protein
MTLLQNRPLLVGFIGDVPKVAELSPTSLGTSPMTIIVLAVSGEDFFCFVLFVKIPAV